MRFNSKPSDFSPSVYFVTMQVYCWNAVYFGGRRRDLYVMCMLSTMYLVGCCSRKPCVLQQNLMRSVPALQLRSWHLKKRYYNDCGMLYFWEWIFLQTLRVRASFQIVPLSIFRQPTSCMRLPAKYSMISVHFCLGTSHRRGHALSSFQHSHPLPTNCSPSSSTRECYCWTLCNMIWGHAYALVLDPACVWMF